MLPDRIMARLSQLNREPLTQAAVSSDAEQLPLRAREKAPQSQLISGLPQRTQPNESNGMRLEKGDAEGNEPAAVHEGDSLTAENRGAVAAVSLGIRPELHLGREVTTDWGPYWEICLPLEQIWPRCHECFEELMSLRMDEGLSRPQLELRSAEVSQTGRGGKQRVSEQVYLERLRSMFPDGAVYLDLETCGLAGMAIFLVGMIVMSEEGWLLRQLWARDYSEEKAILQATWDVCAQNHMLVTFNGKSFDWPQVHDRSTLHQLGRRVSHRKRAKPSAAPIDGVTGESKAAPTLSVWTGKEATIADGAMVGDRPWTKLTARPELEHCDMLLYARRNWRAVVPNCRLQTLERYLCGRRRTDDLPSAEIPAVYHQYVREGSSPHIDGILHHNALDLVTLLQLTVKALRGGIDSPQA